MSFLMEKEFTDLEQEVKKNKKIHAMLIEQGEDRRIDLTKIEEQYKQEVEAQKNIVEATTKWESTVKETEAERKKSIFR